MIPQRLIKITALALLLLLSTAGCWDRKDLNKLGIVLGVALDKGRVPGTFEMTAQLLKPGGNQSGSIGGTQGKNRNAQAGWNVKTEGVTVYQVLRHAIDLSSRTLFWGHNKVIILGEDLAKEGISPYLDFFLRNEEFYPTVWVMVARGKAADILEAAPPLEKVQALNIADLAETQLNVSQSMVVNLVQFSRMLLSPSIAPTASMLEIVEKNQEKMVHMAGSAVFKGDCLKGFLDEEESRGLLWVLGKVESGILVIEKGEDKRLSLKIVQTRGKVIPEFQAGKLRIRIAIDALSDIGEMTEPLDLTIESVVKMIEMEQSKAIRKEIEKAFLKARDLNADVFGIGDAIHKKYPRIWSQLEGDWDQHFPELEIVLEISSSLRRSGVTKNAPIPK